MTCKSILYCSTLTFAFAAAGCSSAPAPAGNAAANVNANTATVVNVAPHNPIGGGSEAAAAPATNSQIPGIPNAPANINLSKEDPTRSAKPQQISRSAPDNSEITTALGENLVETRTFKNNAQIAKIERITEAAAGNKKVIKVYLRNGQVRELPENKVGDVMAESAANILKAVAESGTNSQPAQPAPQPPAAESQNGEKPVKDKRKPPFAKP